MPGQYPEGKFPLSHIIAPVSTTRIYLIFLAYPSKILEDQPVDRLEDIRIGQMVLSSYGAL